MVRVDDIVVHQAIRKNVNILIPTRVVGKMTKHAQKPGCGSCAQTANLDGLLYQDENRQDFQDPAGNVD